MASFSLIPKKMSKTFIGAKDGRLPFSCSVSNFQKYYFSSLPTLPFTFGYRTAYPSLRYLSFERAQRQISYSVNGI